MSACQKEEISSPHKPQYESILIVVQDTITDNDIKMELYPRDFKGNYVPWVKVATYDSSGIKKTKVITGSDSFWIPVKTDGSQVEFEFGWTSQTRDPKLNSLLPLRTNVFVEIRGHRWEIKDQSNDDCLIQSLPVTYHVFPL